MIRYAALRVVVGANALRAVARANEQLAFLRLLGFLGRDLLVQQPLPSMFKAITSPTRSLLFTTGT